jgi:BRCA1-associated protein
VRNVEVLSTRGRPPAVDSPASVKTLPAPAAASEAGQAASSNDTAASATTATAAPAGVSEISINSKQPSARQQAASSTASKDQQRQQTSSSLSSYATALGAQSSVSANSSAAAAASGAASKAAAVAAAAAAGSCDAGSGAEHWLEPPPGTTELPTCPVCLERLDEHISGIVTTVSGGTLRHACEPSGGLVSLQVHHSDVCSWSSWM